MCVLRKAAYSMTLCGRMGKRCSDPNRTIGYRAADNIPQPTSGSTNSNVYNNTFGCVCDEALLRGVSAGGCRRTKLQILSLDSRDPVGGIERSEGPHESAAAIGCNHRHDVQVVVKKV